MLPKASAYVINYDGIKKELDCEPIYSNTFFKTKIRSYDDETTDSYTRKIPGGGPNFICWSVILIDSVL